MATSDATPTHAKTMESSLASPTKESASSVSGESQVHKFDQKLFRSAVWKLDFVVVFFVSAFYLLSFLDRSNIGNARIAGLQKDLHMTDRQYSIALTITYVPYIFAELPSNLILKKVGAKPMLSFYCVAWGFVTVFQGFVRSYSGLLAARFFLGLCEGGLFPGICLYLASFYRRHELQLRMALLFTATSLAGAFSGLLAAAISKMNGLGGHPGWAWIFILEGTFTCLFGIGAYFCIPNDIFDAKFLTEPEREAYIIALREDFNDHEAETPFVWSDVLAAFKSPQVLILCFCLFTNGCTLFGLAYFAPSIVNSLGKYSPSKANLLSVPPYAVSFVVNILLAFIGDRYRARGAVVIFTGLIAMIGYAVYLTTSHKNIAYGALFLQVIGAYGSAPALSAWNPNNVWPHYKRATAIAIAFTFTNSGGILSTWLNVGPPRYIKATRINLAFCVILITAAACNIAYLAWRNKQHAEARKHMTSAEHREPVKSDEDPRWVYTY